MKPSTKLRESVIKKLFHLSRSFRRQAHRTSAVHDLTIGQIQALHLIAANKDGITVTDLATDAQVTPATASQLVDRLVKTGWINREHDTTDKRITRLKLTESGHNNFRSASCCGFDLVNDALKDMSASDLTELDRLLTQFENSYQKLITSN